MVELHPLGKHSEGAVREHSDSYRWDLLADEEPLLAMQPEGFNTGGSVPGMPLSRDLIALLAPLNLNRKS